MGNTTGLHRLDLTPAKAGQLSHVSIKNYSNDPDDPKSLSSNTVGSVMEDRAGIMWVGTNNGLNSFDKKTGIWKRYQNDPGNIHSITSNNLALWFGNGIKEDPNGNLWIGTDKGLNKLNKERTVFDSYSHNPDNTYSLSSNYIIVLQIDEAGILWAAAKAGSSASSSWGAKLNKANLNSKAFGLSRNNAHHINSLSNNAVTAILEDSAGIIWIGTYDGGVNKWDKRTNQFTHLRSDPANPKTLRHDAITAMIEDRHGHLWICNGQVLSQLNKQTGEFTHYYNNDNRVILSITEDQQGLLWLGTGNGIRSFDEKTGEFVSWYYDPNNPEGISDNTVVTIFADSKDNIWIGHGSRGTDMYNKKTRRFRHFKYDPNNSVSISSNIVYSFYEDTKGNLWLGSWAGGLSYFDYKTESFKTFTDKDGLAGNTVFSIVEDNSRHLWLGTRNGISCFDPATKTFTNYDYKDGLQGNVFAAGVRERGARCKGRDGTLYFGGNNGFNFFNPAELKASSHIAPIVITQFKLFDSLVKGAHESKQIVLDHNENYFSFEFSSLSFYNPAKNQYAYKLEGVDKDWVHSGSRRYAAYTNIGPGKYTFRVKGTNNDGVWNEEGTSMIVIINPPWYHTWWAYLLLTLSFVGLVYAFIRYRINKIRMQHEIVLERHKASELEIESRQALLYERLRISRELHDDIGSTLGSISIYSEVAKNRSEKNENTEEVLSKIGLASRILIDKMSDIVWSLDPNNESFEQLQNRMMTFAAMMLAPRNILYDFITDETLKAVQFNSEQRKNIFLIFKEALHNIVKYADCRTVHIMLSAKNDTLMMAIRDDGKGFDSAQLITNEIHKQSEYIGGNGIKNMYARANDMQANLCINSRINEGTSIQLALRL